MYAAVLWQSEVGVFFFGDGEFSTLLWRTSFARRLLGMLCVLRRPNCKLCPAARAASVGESHHGYTGSTGLGNRGADRRLDAADPGWEKVFYKFWV